MNPSPTPLVADAPYRHDPDVGHAGRDPVYDAMPTLTDRVSLTDLHGAADAESVTDFAYATFRHGYRSDLLDAALGQARALHTALDTPRFLSLNHLRHAHDTIEEIRRLMVDPDRLAYLSNVVGCALEPYPIPTAASHVNFYRPGEKTIDFHTDGCAFVELIPLEITGPNPDTATVVSSAAPRRDRGVDVRPSTDPGSMTRVRHALGQSVLLQGRSVLHSADVLHGGSRTTLVLPMRAIDQPWKDDNTLFRLLQDDEPEEVVAHWVRDVVEVQVPAYRTHLGDIR